MKSLPLKPSVISLLFSNILVIILALVQGWEVATVLWVYWMQSVIIGSFQFLRILSLKNFSAENFTINNQPVSPTTQTKTFTAFFFAFHYGFFHFIYAIFLFNFFIKQPLDFPYLFLGGFIFFINHLFSYHHNRILDQAKKQNIGQLMFSPYARIIPMHLIIVFGAILGQSSLIIFLLLKTLVDIVMHSIKHKLNYSIQTS
ncbi:hypothetical protein HYW42_03870 [Candidatus Daviesbacteria bacterium]|nr:hypothetical protein [Candidatus Daviesbacteria bacterium]